LQISSYCCETSEYLLTSSGQFFLSVIFLATRWAAKPQTAAYDAMPLTSLREFLLHQNREAMFSGIYRGFSVTFISRNFI
jgi:hypothetical protein